MQNQHRKAKNLSTFKLQGDETAKEENKAVGNIGR